MPISGHGFELHVRRLGLHRTGARTRTYGAYQAYRDGEPILHLAGHVCECIGPGDNSVADNKKRVAAGRYPLATHFGEVYRTADYAQDTAAPALRPMPGLLLRDTDRRTAILIHPGHPPDLFLSSVGCLNLTRALRAGDAMEFRESRERVIALIESLRRHDPAAFASPRRTTIADAFVVIDGEPMDEPMTAPPGTIV